MTVLFFREQVDRDALEEHQLVNNFRHINQPAAVRARMLMEDRQNFYGVFNMVGEDNFEDYEYPSDEEDTDILWGKNQAGKKVQVCSYSLPSLSK